MAGRAPHTPRALRRLLAALLALIAVAAGAGTALAADDATAPQSRWPVGGSAVSTAMELAAGHWGMTPCSGRVTVAWKPLAAQVNATSLWAYAGNEGFRRPARNTECEIDLSSVADWDWPKLCTVLVHEVGHLTGHDHVLDAHDVMYPTYVAPVVDCAQTPEPAPDETPLSSYATDLPVAAAPAVPAAKPAKAVPTRRKASPRRASRGASKRSKRS
jgi:hypothetical protein